MSLVKRQKTAVNGFGHASNTINNSERTSSLLDDSLILEGHQGAAFASRFSPDGSVIASGGRDKKLYLWNTPTANIITDPQTIPVNFASLTGHKSAITSLRWTRDGSSIVTASADHTAGLWDLISEKRVRKFQGHELVVNDVDVLVDSYSREELIVSVSDDEKALIWDTRKKSAINSIRAEYPLLAVAASSQNSSDKNLIFTSGIDSTIQCFDIRQSQDPVFQIETAHSDAITSLSLSGDSTTLISGSMDGTVRFYDSSYSLDNEDVQRVKPIIFDEAPSGTEKLLIRSRLIERELDDGSVSQLVVAGSEDKSVTVWDVKKETLLGKLYGHGGAVVDVDFHPTENIILSGSEDGTLIVREV